MMHRENVERKNEILSDRHYVGKFNIKITKVL